MRLLNSASRQLEEFSGAETPPYAILSHTWGSEEVTFAEIHDKKCHKKDGYQKVKYACQQAAKDDLQYVWIDTCCIDKSSSSELSEAINSMFRWYSESKVCYAFLEDVDPSKVTESLRLSRWFTRGWTLQELIAPRRVKFFGHGWNAFGSKRSLSYQLSEVTEIDELTLILPGRFRECSIAQRMSWASRRKTTRLEDRAYSLLGIFDVHMPLLYGEGSRAFIRLQEEIMKGSNDQSLFAWGSFVINPINRMCTSVGILANTPELFANSGKIVPAKISSTAPSYSMTNNGLRISLHLLPLDEAKKFRIVGTCDPHGGYRYQCTIPASSKFYLGILNCQVKDEFHSYIGLNLLEPVPHSSKLVRIQEFTQHHIEVTLAQAKLAERRLVYIGNDFIINTLQTMHVGRLNRSSRICRIECNPPDAFVYHVFSTEWKPESGMIKVGNSHVKIAFYNMRTEETVAILLKPSTARVSLSCHSFADPDWIKPDMMKPQHWVEKIASELEETSFTEVSGLSFQLPRRVARDRLTSMPKLYVNLCEEGIMYQKIPCLVVSMEAIKSLAPTMGRSSLETEDNI